MKSNFLIVGLGNPGKKYEFTKHNCGFLVIQELINRFEIKLIKKKFYLLGERYFINIKKRVKAFFLLPSTYMNNSGIAVKNFLNDITDNINIVVIHDDIALPVGKIRLKRKGGHGGHNGVKSIIREIGSENFFRFKIGIGKPNFKENIPNYVLSTFTEEEFQNIKNPIKKTSEAIIKLFFEPIDKVYNFIN